MTNNNEYMGLMNFMFKKSIWIIIAVAVTILVVISYLFFFHSAQYTSETTMIIRKTGDSGYPGSGGYLNTSEFEVYSKMVNDSEAFVRSRYFYNILKKNETVLNDIDYSEYLESVFVESELDSNIFHVIFKSRRDKNITKITNAIAKELINNYSEILVDAEIKFIDEASVKNSSTARDLVLSVTTATAVSAGMAVVVIFFWNFRTPHIKSIYDLDKKITNFDNIIQLDSIKKKKFRKYTKHDIGKLKNILSSYKLFVDRLYITNKKNNVKILLVTSPNPDPNKTQLCALICKFLVDKKSKVALINLEADVDYADYYEQIDINKFVTRDYLKKQDMTNYPTDVFTIKNNTFVNEKMVSDLIETMKSDTKYDFIIVNAPSVLDDSILLDKYEELDKVIVAISELKTIKDDAINVLELLETYVSNVMVVYMKI